MCVKHRVGESFTGLILLLLLLLFSRYGAAGAEESSVSPVRHAPVAARDYAVVPDTGRDMGPAFRSMLDTVIAAGKAVAIELERGRYRIGSGPRYDAALAVVGAHELVIRGVGPETEIILTDPRQGGFFVADSRHVWIEALSIDHDPLPYTQGHILLLDAEAGWFDFVTQQAYPNLDEAWFADAPKPYGQWGMIFDAQTPRLKEGAADFVFMDRWERLGERAWRMYPVADQRERINDMRLGDRFVHMARHGKGGAAFFWRSSESGVRNLIVYASQSLAVGSVSADRIVVDALTVTRRPDTDRLLSTNSDGVHCQQNIRGPIIQYCRFEGMADDGINIYYNPNTVTGVISDTVIRATRGGVVEKGDILQLFEPGEGRILGEVEVREIGPTPDDEYRITFAKAVAGLRDAPEGLALYNLSRCGADYEIRYNEFRNHRRHGMMLKAPHGLIEHNIIEGVGGLGMVIGNDPEWPEGIIPFDLVIRNNSITDVGRSRWYGAAPRGAAIQLSTKALGGRLAAERRLCEVTLENNIIINPPGAALYIGAAHDIIVRDLRVIYREDGRLPRVAPVIIVEDAAAVRIEQPRIEYRQQEGVAALLIEETVDAGEGGVFLDNLQLTGPPGMSTVIDRRR